MKAADKCMVTVPNKMPSTWLMLNIIIDCRRLFPKKEGGVVILTLKWLMLKLGKSWLFIWDIC